MKEGRKGGREEGRKEGWKEESEGNPTGYEKLRLLFVMREI